MNGYAPIQKICIESADFFVYIKKKLYLCTRKGVSGRLRHKPSVVYESAFAWQSRAWVSA